MGVGEPPRDGVDIETSDGVTIVSISRDLDLSCAPAAHRAVDRVLADGARVVCVDLDGAQFIDSSGIAVLLRLVEATDTDGGRTIVATTASGVLRVLSLLGVDRRVTIVPDRATALRPARS